MSSTVNVNQLARKGNLVVQLDISPSSYTAHPFNSNIALTGTDTSVLTWPNKWIDLSDNNNHAYPCTTTSPYTSSANFPLTSSYLNNNIYFNGSINNFRLNPIQETTGPLSVFVWVKRKGTGSDSDGQWIISKRVSLFNDPLTFWQISFVSNTAQPRVAIGNTSASPPVLDSPISVTNNIWANIGFTVEGQSSTSIVRAYLNGIQYGTAAVGGNGMNIGSQQIIMGKKTWTNGGTLNADMSQVLIYNA
jgi:hypothetical protein